MANENLALLRPRPSDAGGERDYESFCAALGASARGRAFLAEYAKRNRHADTKVLLAALNRLETMVRSQAAASDSERLRRELVALHDAIRATRNTIDDGSAALRADRLAALIERTERHIAAMLAPAAAAEPDLPIPAPANDEPRAAAPVLEAETPRALPKPAAAPVLEAEIPRPMSEPATAAASADAQVVHAQVVHTQPLLDLPEIDFFDGTAPARAAASSPPPVAAVAPRVKTETAISAIAALMEFPPPGAVESRPSTTKAEKPASNAPAAIMALSEAERIALFT